MNSESESERSWRSLAGEAGMKTYQDRIAETERVREGNRARIERGEGNVPMEPWNRDDEQVAVRQCGRIWPYITENHHEENRISDIQVSKKGSEAASEEQSDEWRKTERLEHEAPNASASSDPYVALEYPASGETQSRPESVLVQKSGHVDDDVQISALDAFYEKDGRKSRCIGEVLEWCRG